MEVKVVLNVVCVIPDGPSLYRVYLDSNFKSPSKILTDNTIDQALAEIYEECFSGNIPEIPNLVDVRQNGDRIIIYYSLCVDRNIQQKSGKFVNVDSLNSEILHKILQKIDMSVRF